MTQQDTAVGGSNDTVVAAEPTLEDRFAAFGEDQQDEEEPVAAEDGGDGNDPPEPPENDDAEDEPGEDPAIDPPVSWTAEEKEEFKSLPRALQETLTRREAEREKFVQSKAQEAAKTRLIVEQQAAEWRTTKLQADARLLQDMLPQVPEKPSPRLQLEDAYAYADQMEAYEWSIAQHNAIVQRHQEIQAELGQMQVTMKTQQSQLDEQTLRTQFPEFLDAEKGPELKKALASTALALGYSDDQLAHVDAQDVHAMKTASEWKAKADKFDTLMAKQMQTVRDAKALPKVSRPGAPVARGAVANQRYQADREAMRNGDRDAGARVFKNFI
jgi:hypothetical protein